MNISLYVGNRYLLYFNRTDYFTYDSVKRQCLLTIIENTDTSATYWLMGDSFMRAYYVIHDMANQLIGFAGQYQDLGLSVITTSEAATLVANTGPDTLTYVLWMAVGMVALIALVVLVLIIRKLCCKNKKPKLQPSIEMSTPRGESSRVARELT